ncbi:hypothetical protein [Actinobacillus equuli]|uniref:hypothetical protein n=1 Tax=Actinobacillus equuli TaxID=718 RepID=UPI0024422599|nr:hypothetical protein [Actinobacillus equuli]WGE85483.1 hypothetical protein NYR87_10295 [Actinobacillus equuli subsp. haemolyticus]
MSLAIPIAILVYILALCLIIAAISGTIVICGLLGTKNVVVILLLVAIATLIYSYSSEIGEAIKFIALTISATICFLGMGFSFILTKNKVFKIFITIACFLLLYFIADIYIILTALAITIVWWFFYFKI